MAEITVGLNGVTIGVIQDDLFRKDIIESKHLLRKPEAIAYDKSVIRGLKANGVTRLLVVAKDTHRFFEATIETLEEHGLTVNRGYGDQIALPLAYWKIRKEIIENLDA